jgi:RimJ/RimL family protein N-acetyltransferase
MGEMGTTVEAARLLLRPWQPNDLAEFTRLLTDPVVTRYIVVHTPFSPQDVAGLSERTLEQWERNGFGPGVRGQVLMSFLVRAHMSVAGQAGITPGHHLHSKA